MNSTLHRGLLAVSLTLLAPNGFAQEQAPDAAVVELRATISKIVDVKTQASKEASDWEIRKAEMNELLGLHRRELALLGEELETAGQSAGGYDETKQAAEKEIQDLKEARRATREAVARNQPRMLVLAKNFPAPLRDDTEVERIILESWQPGDEPRDGLQAILGMIAKAEQFNRRITRAKEERDGREVEVLYLGLARGYYADRSGNAGTGEPGADGWSWTPRPELNDEVLNAFDQLDKKRPPALVELPVKIMEVAE